MTAEDGTTSPLSIDYSEWNGDEIMEQRKHANVGIKNIHTHEKLTTCYQIRIFEAPMNTQKADVTYFPNQNSA